ncbi:ABC transporter substrate-binding protein [Terrihabitans sp. B22-R8]|uniref:ABC transporter substrate-binding protein n=1 Tax=Terrihabitans sp. B22-R8 TaxID=3425128 RepID=UPI00403C5475
MRTLVAAALALLFAGAAATWARDIEDATGRRFTLPDKVERVFAAGPPAGLVIYSMAPGSLLGWTRALSAEQLRMLPKDAAKPSTGRLTGRGGEANFEAVLRLDPEIIIDLGSTDQTYVSLAERVQQTTGVPHLLFDGRLMALPATYRLLAAALGAPAADEQAQWIETRLDKIRDALAGLAEGDRPRVYLARGPEGLESGRPGSITGEIIEIAGGRNAVPLGGGGLVTISLEQLLSWNPDIIVALDPSFYEAARNDPLWQQVRAVREGRIVLSPQEPFPWVDYPPSVNRALGAVWMAALLHPQRMHTNIRSEAEDFYRLFYHRTPTSDELDRLLAHAVFR